MLFFKMFLASLSGFLISIGLVMQVRRILKHAENRKFSVGVLLKVLGIIILGYLVITYKTQDLIYELLSFFISALIIISWILLARRSSIR